MILKDKKAKWIYTHQWDRIIHIFMVSISWEVEKKRRMITPHGYSI